MTDLGLLPSDLLRRQRGFVLVEGLHDELVLEELFKAELQRLRVEILPMRGTTQLSPAKISFLFDHTPAKVFVMLDNIRTADLAETWERVLELTAENRLDQADLELQAAACLETDEGRKLRKVLSEVVLSGRGARVTPFGLSHADIIEYLPVGSLVPGETDWADLRSRHRAARAADRGASPDFKKWLRHTLRADDSEPTIRAAVRDLDTIPPDLLRLLKTVEAHTGDPGRRRT